MDVEAFLAQKAARTEDALRAYLDTWRGAPDALDKAVRYSLFAGGKRLRPALALGAAEIISGDDCAALPAACALEMIHTFSLIHDDLPALDNDDLRRGKPALHRVCGEALAILAGDTLLVMAFDVLGQANDVRVVRDIAQATGAAGMAGGQVMDIEAAGKPVSLDALRRIHACKTGALIRAAVRSGAILAGAPEDKLEALTRYGDHLGLAFQIADDILDVTGNEETLGKPIGSDAANLKPTYPVVVGMEAARAFANQARDAAIQALEPFGPEAGAFRALAAFVVARRK